VNISSLIPPVNTATLKQPKRSEIAVAGSETNKDAPHARQENERREQKEKHEAPKKRGQDRRQRNIKPLLDSRTGGDRRKDHHRPVINVNV
jgi:hypothetical protein